MVLLDSAGEQQIARFPEAIRAAGEGQMLPLRLMNLAASPAAAPTAAPAGSAATAMPSSRPDSLQRPWPRSCGTREVCSTASWSPASRPGR